MSEPRRLDKNLCLMMIVKNEEKTLPRLLESVLPVISSWVIIDTGSTDKTIEVIHNSLSSIPGQLSESPWVNFGVNRSELISKIPSDCDFALLLDADQTFHFESVEKLFDELSTHPSANCLLLKVRGDGLEYGMPYIVRPGPSYRYVGSTHEYIAADVNLQRELITSAWLEHHGDGGSKSDKYQRDRELLEKDILEGNGSSRTHFYLAQTYEALGLKPEALKHYEIAHDSSTWDEEKYVSRLRAGRISKALGQNDLSLQLFFDAYELCPDRSEALYEIVKHLEERGAFFLAHRLLKSANYRSKNRILFLEPWITQWGLPIEEGVVAWRVGHKAEAKEIFESVLKVPGLSEETIALVEKNLQFC